MNKEILSIIEFAKDEGEYLDFYNLKNILIESGLREHIKPLKCMAGNLETIDEYDGEEYYPCKEFTYYSRGGYIPRDELIEYFEDELSV